MARASSRGRGGGGLAVEGLDDLIRGLARMDKKLAGEVRRELRKVGKPIVAAQRATALRKGLRKSGKLARGNRAAVRGSTLVVQNRVTNDGYPYPLRYEFEGRGESPGPRAFFYRPAEDAMPDVETGFDEMLGRLAGEEGF